MTTPPADAHRDVPAPAASADATRDVTAPVADADALHAALSAQRAAHAVLVDPGCEPRRAAGLLVDAWQSLSLATCPDKPVPTDSELPDRAAALLAGRAAAPGEQARVRDELRALLVERARAPWDRGSFPLERAALEAHARRLAGLIADARARAAGAPPAEASPLLRALGLAAGVTVIGLLLLRPWQTPVGPWRAAYYTRHDFTGDVVRRHDVAVDFDWGRRPPLDTIPADRFSVRWDSCLDVPATGDVAFQLVADERARLYIDGELRLDTAGERPLQARGELVRLTRGLHHLRVDYSELTRDASVVLHASLAGEPPGPLPAGVLRRPSGKALGKAPCKR